MEGKARLEEEREEKRLQHWQVLGNEEKGRRRAAGSQASQTWQIYVSMGGGRISSRRPASMDRPREREGEAEALSACVSACPACHSAHQANPPCVRDVCQTG